MTPEQSNRIEELMDPNKVTLYCGIHNYFGPSKGGVQVKPALGCPRCCMVMYFYDIVNTAPERRAERLDELTEVLHKVAELSAKGKWDFTPYEHAQIENDLDISKEFD